MGGIVRKMLHRPTHQAIHAAGIQGGIRTYGWQCGDQGIESPQLHRVMSQGILGSRWIEERRRRSTGRNETAVAGGQPTAFGGRTVFIDRGCPDTATRRCETARVRRPGLTIPPPLERGMCPGVRRTGSVTQNVDVCGGHGRQRSSTRVKRPPQSAHPCARSPPGAHV